MVRARKGRAIFIAAAMSLVIWTNACTMQDDEPLEDPIFLAGAGAALACKSLAECFTQFAGTTTNGAALMVYKTDGTMVYENTSGATGYDTTVPIFSASKLMTAAVIMAAIDATAGFDLNTTTGSTLSGWTGAKANITMRQLLAFTSGLVTVSGSRLSGSESCISSLSASASDADKDACIAQIRDNTSNDYAPGSTFVYNSNHMAVAQRMAEIKTGKAWQTLFNDEIATPMGFTSEKTWYGNITDKSGDGSLAGAYGLYLSPRDYLNFLRMLLNNGTFNSTTVLTSASVTEIFQDQFESNTTIGYSQFALFGYRWRYGLGNWRFCTNTTDATACDTDLVSHSFGANGFYPWVDRNRGYATVIGVNGIQPGLLSIIPSSAGSLFFGETIKPYILQSL